ncbi:unnamed protein product [Pleuronectes platessa]|uniref:Uncharacterized protein n=1 Tax=Pleuronectes platessa TaxID=8262 RepID=A0A9N7U210_PLEPL|nr:unnamed protein product [Pleuronectes platessa]
MLHPNHARPDSPASCLSAGKRPDSFNLIRAMLMGEGSPPNQTARQAKKPVAAEREQTGELTLLEGRWSGEWGVGGLGGRQSKLLGEVTTQSAESNQQAPIGNPKLQHPSIHLSFPFKPPSAASFSPLRGERPSSTPIKSATLCTLCIVGLTPWSSADAAGRGARELSLGGVRVIRSWHTLVTPLHTHTRSRVCPECENKIRQLHGGATEENLSVCVDDVL